jgi:adenylate cyclase
MKSHSIPKTISRIRKIVLQETGQDLSRHALREIEAELVATDIHKPTEDNENADFQAREVTILLADLRGFTALAEEFPAGTVIQMLNPVLICMSKIIFKHGGTIDKFMGDAIMVLFGALTKRDDDVARALACAVEMQSTMQFLNTEHRAKNLPELYMGIGINTGEVLAGVLGSDVYSEYTVIGDEVNLAARIEAFSLRGQVLISESTFNCCRDFVETAEPMTVHVKGKSETINVREVLSIPTKGLRVPRQEIRRSHRVDVRLPFTYQLIRGGIVLPELLHGVMHDIGYHGVLVELTEPQPPMAEMKISVDLPHVSFVAENVYGKVVNQKARDGKTLTGVEFTSVPASVNTKIQLFVQLLVFSD